MSASFAGLALALLASCALNGGYLLQHAGSRAAPAIDLRRLGRALRELVRAPLWLAGLAAGLVGWGLHVAALSAAPLSLVQAFSAGGLALLAPVAALTLRAHLRAAEKRAVALTVFALAALGIGATAPPTAAVVPALPLAVFVGASAVAAGILALAGRGRRRAHVLGAAGGMLYGAGDAATKAVTVAAHAGGLAGALATPWLLVVVVASAAAFLCFQRGLQVGPVVPVVALMTTATNAVAIGAGILVFGDPLGSSPLLGVIHALAFALAGLGAWRLSGAQARIGGAERAPHPSPGG